MDIKVNFTFHSVGQGLFYTGRMESFNFVYDCGSENRSRLSKSISDYKNNRLGKDILNLLIISHFHNDHIIGLEELLKNLDVDTVILPYLTPIERLIISLRKLYLPAWYYEFLSNPIRFLLIDKKNVGKIIIIGGKEGEKSGDLPEGLPPNKPENVKIKWEDGMRDDKELRMQIKEYEDPEWDKFIDGGKLFVKSHYDYVTALNGFWVFKFFNYKLEDQKISAFENCLRQNNLSPENSETLRKIIKDKNQLSKLKGCYKILNRDLNHTSLIAYHGPISKYRSNIKCFCKNPYFHSICFSCYGYLRPPFRFHDEIGQLLTGDINLNFRWKDIANHFGNCLQNDISIVQIPHHGAKRNWNTNLLNTIKDHSMWIISRGISNKYGHPHVKVIDDIVNNRRCLCWSNEINEVNIEGSVSW